ncbi:MAG: ATP-binding cassette domain-containing protein [Xanthobacteraceae bacterium]
MPNVQGEPSMLTSLWDFLHDFAGYAGAKAVSAGVLVAVGAVLEALGLILIIPLISLAIGSNLPAGKIGKASAAALQAFGVETRLGRLAFLLGVFGVLIVVRAVVISIRDVKVVALQTGFVEALRLRIAQCLVGAQWDQVVRLRHARITHLMSGDIQRIGAMTQFFLQFAVSGAMLIAQCILVLAVAPAFAAVALALLLLGAIAFLPVIRRAHVIGGITTNANLSLLDSTAQFLGGLKLAISQNLQGRFIDEFRQSLHELTRRQIDFARHQSRVRVTLMTLPAVASGGLVLLGFGVFHLAPATLIALVLIISRMIGPVSQLQQGAQQLVNVLPAYEKAKELEKELTTMPQQQPREAAPVSLPDGPIEVRNIAFRHAPDSGDTSARGIENVSLTIQPGEIVGITGPSGAGKTTFADMLVGLYPPQQGRIFIAGSALEGAVLTAWRDSISYVSQDPYLFHDTVRRNLVWASPQSSEQDIWDALSLVGADRLVRGMESGLDTVVGERGTLLSGGERQRIALARAILRKPRLLLLDEATGAIDIDGERKILEGLGQLRPRPTIVTIAHRLESLALCERVFCFEAGRCVEEAVAEGRPLGAAIMG